MKIFKRGLEFKKQQHFQVRQKYKILAKKTISEYINDNQLSAYIQFYRNQMNKIVRNQSAQTVTKQPITINFIIYHLEEEVLRLTMKSTESSGDLLNAVRNKLARKFENIIGLASIQGYYTLDYALQVQDYKLAGIKKTQELKLLFQQIVADANGPTLADFCFLACLGEGVSACVFLVRHTASGKLFALKQIKKEYFRQFRTLETVLREKKILCEIVSDMPLATKLQGSFQSENHLNFLLEFYPGGEFFYHLSQRKLTQDEAKLCFAQILVTMEQLHQRKILYRDLKPENIMIDYEGHLILGDFGLCRINLEKEELAHSHCGSPEYMAYQTKQSQGYSFPADYYTMGALIHEMVRGVPPFYNGQLPSYEGASQGFRELVQALIRQDPNQRLSNPQQLKRSKWLQGINWQKVKNKQLVMPIRLNLYMNYIHSQFLQKEFDFQTLRIEGKYDRLFDMFSFLNDRSDIAAWYPLARRGKKSNIKRGRSKQHSTHSNRGKVKSRNSSQSSERSKSKQKFKALDSKKSIKQPNIYQGYFQRQNPKHKAQKHKNDVSYKSNSKNKQQMYKSGKNILKQTKQLGSSYKDQLVRTKSPIMFKTLTSARSSGNLKGSEYIKELDKSASNRKKMV